MLAIIKTGIQASNPALWISLIVFVRQRPRFPRKAINPLKMNRSVLLRILNIKVRKELINLRWNQHAMSSRIIII